jgi:hypothetical protein
MADIQMPDGSVRSVPEATSPFEAVSEVVANLGDVVGRVVEGIQDLTATPLDVAKEHMDHVNELHVEMIAALSHGDVDAASALNAQAGEELNEAIAHLGDPDAVQTHHAEAHHDGGSAMPPDMTHLDESLGG